MPVQSLLISIYPMQLFADFAVEVRGGGGGGGGEGGGVIKNWEI